VAIPVAYHDTETITAVKSFTVPALGAINNCYRQGFFGVIQTRQAPRVSYQHLLQIQKYKTH
jgi:hypothetical protein